MEAYLRAAGINLADPASKKQPIFRSINARRLDRTEVYRMIGRSARQAGLSTRACCHTFRATGITADLENGGTIEKAQQIAAHESPRTTKLYDRAAEQMSLDEIERVVI